MRRNAADGDDEQPLVMVNLEPEAVREAKRRWAELLRHIFEVDALECPRCGQEMHIVSLITELKTIDRIIEHLENALKPHADANARRPDAGSRPQAPLRLEGTPKSPDVRCSGEAGLRGCADYHSVTRCEPES